MNPEDLMVGISNEIAATLKVMAKARTPEEKLALSATVKNLCESLGVFLDLLSDMVPYDDDDSGDPIPF
jgi:hypothetical protein